MSFSENETAFSVAGWQQSKIISKREAHILRLFATLLDFVVTIYWKGTSQFVNVWLNIASTPLIKKQNKTKQNKTKNKIPW